MIALVQEKPKSQNKIEIERKKWEEIPLYDFVREFWPVIEPGKPFVDGKHIEAICLHLEAVLDGRILRLIVNMPPRHAKSSIISVLFRVWTWIKKPSLRWLCASYALSLATRDNVKCRRLILSPKFQEHYGHIFTLTKDQNAKIKFENDQRGYCQAVSVGSSATGEGGDILLIDDPHSIDETRSDITREGTLEWFKDTWCTRLNDQQTSAMIVVGQRVHSKDLSGYILAGKTGEHWVHLNLATEFEPQWKCVTSLPNGTEFWRDWRNHEGELLWPDRFPKYVIDRAKMRHGSFAYAALYQQSPMPSDGGVFKSQWIRYFEEADNAYILHTPNGDRSVLKSDCWRFTVVDLAISLKQTADYTVIQTYDVTPQNDLLLIDQIRDRMDNPTQQRTIRLVYATLKPRFVKIETVGYQLAILQELRDTPTEPTDFVVTAANPEALDNTIRQLGWANAYLVKNKLDIYEMVQGKYYVARVLGDKEYFKFAVEKQGYCKIIDQAELNKFSIPLREYRPSKDKVTRASTPAIQMENGKMYFRQGAHYLTDLVTEILMFPKGANDDMVDTLGMAADEVIQPQGIIAWSVGDDTPTRTLEMAELPENNLRTMMEIEKSGVEDDEGEYYTYGGDY